MKQMQQIPARVFLDSSTLQTLQDFGGFIYNGCEIPEESRIWKIPDGFNNVDALRKIMIAGSRGGLQLALSQNSLLEVIERGKYDYLQWAIEMLEYWNGCIAA